MKITKKDGILFLVIAILLPYVLTMLANRKPDPSFQEKRAEEEFQILSELDRKVYKLLIASINEKYPMEALKAQAIILRSEILYQEQRGGFVEGTEKNTLPYMDSCMKAVTFTSGQVLTYENQLICPPYHALSAGMTRSVDGEESADIYPYLKSADCKRDVEAADYLSMEGYTLEEFAKLIKEAYPNAPIKPESLFYDFHIEDTDAYGYVKSVSLCNEKIQGGIFRRKIGLKSDSFVIEPYEQGVRVTTRGIGHGYGFDQYQASLLASEGMQSEEILQYFFSNIVIADANKITENR